MADETEVKQIPKKQEEIVIPAYTDSKDILIIQKKFGNPRLTAKVRAKVYKGYSPNKYVKVISPKDPNDLALLMEDLQMLFGAPVERAFQKFKQRKNGNFPFY